MKASREIDALVAEKVMGFSIYKDNEGHLHNFSLINMRGEPTFVPYYSVDISAAWEAVERLLAVNPKQNDFELGYGYSDSGDPDWWASFGYTEPSWEEGICVIEDGDTAPLAICMAALRLVYETRRRTDPVS